MHYKTFSVLPKIVGTLLISLIFTSLSFGQIDRIEKERARLIVSTIKNSLEKNYYDPAFHGVNLDERFKAAEEKLKQVNSLGGAYGVIAQTLVDLNDTHTFFLPPQRSAKVEYGWQMGIVADKPYIIAVKPKSDADKKGLHVGDLVLSVNGFKPTRSEMWKMNYYYYQISPRSSMKLVVQSPGAEPKEIEIAANVKQLKRVINLDSDTDINDLIRDLENESRREFHEFERVGNVAIWKMPSFSFDPEQVDSIMQDKIKGSSALILDLRGNPGGHIKTLERLVGYLFDKDVKIADMKGRTKTEASTGVSRGANSYTGSIVVLVDSRSASCAEILARVLQIEKRGYVIGDNTAGAVMESRSFSMETGTDRIVPYGVNITAADV